MTDMINHPPHYTQHPSGLECIQVTEHMSFNLGNAVKYIWRHDHKNAKIDDLKKAKWYVDREVTRREGPHRCAYMINPVDQLKIDGNILIEHMGFHLGTAMLLIIYADKDPGVVGDLVKAAHHIHLEIERLEKPSTPDCDDLNKSAFYGAVDVGVDGEIHELRIETDKGPRYSYFVEIDLAPWGNMLPDFLRHKLLKGKLTTGPDNRDVLRTSG